MKKSSTIRRNAMISAIGLVVGLLTHAALARQELIVNGSFESGAQATMDGLPGWGWIGPAGNHSDYGVAQSGISPDLAEQGSFYAFFHGAPTDGSQDCLGQTVNLTVGAQYTVSYYLATDGTTLGSNASMIVVIGTSFGIDYSQDILLTAYVPNSSNALAYQKFTTNITATTSSEILSFHGVDPTSSILLDNVSMTPYVAPASPLNVSLSPTNTLVFAWTSPTAVYFIQANASLGTTNWVTLTNAPVTNGSNSQIVLPVPASNQFYRLAPR
jgi:hypothetical protein